MKPSKGLVVALVLLVAAAAWSFRASNTRKDLVTVEEPELFAFQCAECDHQWSTDTRTASLYYGGGFPTETRPISCPSCENRRAFLETECLFCHEGWLPDYVINGQGVPSQLICPHCGKDSLTWRRGAEGSE